MMDKFTSQFQSILGQAQSMALGLGNQFIEPVHILSALLTEQASLLQLAGVDVAKLKASVDENCQACRKCPDTVAMCNCRKTADVC